MIRDWYAFWLVSRFHNVHLATDPACAIHIAARPGSRLDRYSRGQGCPRCWKAGL